MQDFEGDQMTLLPKSHYGNIFTLRKSQARADLELGSSLSLRELKTQLRQVIKKKITIDYIHYHYSLVVTSEVFEEIGEPVV